MIIFLIYMNIKSLVYLMSVEKKLAAFLNESRDRKEDQVMSWDISVKLLHQIQTSFISIEINPVDTTGSGTEKQ